LTSPEAEGRIAFVGSYPPRRCGIATFTKDLATGIATADPALRPMVLAMTEPEGEHAYGAEVEYEIRERVRADYVRAAELVNYSDARLVSIQHEHGIFGGDDGAYIIDFVAALRRPALVTLHTVLKSPSPSQRAVVRRIAHEAAATVVMSRVAADFLTTSYGVDPARVRVIPHGIPTITRAPKSAKAKFGVADRRVMLSFGLLGPNKGIETVIRALPALVERFPDLVYFVVGATHPTIVRHHGEAYRISLEREAEQLGVREHVVFRDQFVTTEELCAYLQAADVFVSAYRNEAQVTSGALSYAMGAGAAVVSTPYWHASELLADGRGLLFPFGDHRALATAVGSLLGEPRELDRVRAAAFEMTRGMTWPQIGKSYVELGRAVIANIPAKTGRQPSSSPSSLPELRLDHLVRLTDDTGVIQHATFTVPARTSGYCVDDNARALIVALHADREVASPVSKRLVTTYLAYLQHAQTERGDFDNLTSYARQVAVGSGSEDCLGRALWALGSTVHLAADAGCRRLARQMFERALPRSSEVGPRGSATTILGLAEFLRAEPEHAGARAAIGALGARLLSRYQEGSSVDWHWFEPSLTYDNALLPLALFELWRIDGDRASLRVARESLDFLEGICFGESGLALVGNAGWHSRGGKRPHADEQAIDAAAFVLAFRGAYLATSDRHYLVRMRQAFAWFLGANRLGVPLYDSDSGGCRDGLCETEVNANQGAESTICFLLALLEILALAADGLEPPRLGPVDG
jgi:glycosyltransferase involved in cell wall biosynthesis